MSDDVFGSASAGDVSSQQDTSDLQDDVEQDTKQLNVEIPAELHRQLKAKSALEDKPMKRMVADILDRNLET
jgi:tartrate dehydratase alpha subunit/fumarate hydratase class I-like protein